MGPDDTAQARARSAISKVGLTRNGPITLGLRENLDWLLDPTPEDDQGLGGAARDILNVLTKRGASFQSDIAKLSRSGCLRR